MLEIWIPRLVAIVAGVFIALWWEERTKRKKLEIENTITESVAISAAEAMANDVLKEHGLSVKIRRKDAPPERFVHPGNETMH